MTMGNFTDTFSRKNNLVELKHFLNSLLRHSFQKGLCYRESFYQCSSKSHDISISKKNINFDPSFFLFSRLLKDQFKFHMQSFYYWAQTILKFGIQPVFVFQMRQKATTRWKDFKLIFYINKVEQLLQGIQIKTSTYISSEKRLPK